MRACLSRSQLVAAMLSNIMAIDSQNPGSASTHEEQLAAFAVLGPHVRTNNAAEMSGQNGKIGPLWQRFMGGEGETIPNPTDRQTIFAVYSNYESNETGLYDLTLGKRVEPEQQVPANMRILHIPAARYLVFSVAGANPDAIKSAWGSIYAYFANNHAQRRAFTYDFEQYSGHAVQIFIAIQ
jgi:predicted transcriptional regulator YdeE